MEEIFAPSALAVTPPGFIKETGLVEAAPALSLAGLVSAIPGDLLLAGITAAAPASSAPVFVKETGGSLSTTVVVPALVGAEWSGTSGTAKTWSLPAHSITAGNDLFIWVIMSTGSQAPSPTLSDNLGNGYSLVPNLALQIGTLVTRWVFLYTAHVNVGGSATITLNNSNTDGTWAAKAKQFSGIQPGQTPDYQWGTNNDNTPGIPIISSGGSVGSGSVGNLTLAAIVQYAATDVFSSVAIFPSHAPTYEPQISAPAPNGLTMVDAFDVSNNASSPIGTLQANSTNSNQWITVGVSLRPASAALTLTPANTSGNLLVLCIGAAHPATSGKVLSVSDSGGNIWQPFPGVQPTSGAALWYSNTTHVAGTVSVQMTAPDSMVASCLEFSGQATGTVADALGWTALDAKQTAPAAVTTTTTLQANEVAVAFVWGYGGSAGTDTLGGQTAGFVVQGTRTDSSNDAMQSAYRILSATGTVTYGLTDSTQSEQFIVIVGTFLAAPVVAPQVSTVTDSGGNTWARLTTRHGGGVNFNYSAEVWSTKVGASPGTLTITANSSCTVAATILEFASVGSFEAANTSADFSVAPSTNFIQNSSSTDVFVGFISQVAAAPPSFSAPGGGFTVATQRTSTGGGVAAAVKGGYLLPALVNPQGFSLTSDTSALWSAALVVWQGAPPVAGFANPMTVQGDLIAGAVTGIASRLAVGASGAWLTSDGTNPAWSVNPRLGSGAKLRSGSGAPTAVAGDAVGDLYLRTDTPTTANQRIYICTVAATTYLGIL